MPNNSRNKLFCGDKLDEVCTIGITQKTIEKTNRSDIAWQGKNLKCWRWYWAEEHFQFLQYFLETQQGDFIWTIFCNIRTTLHRCNWNAFIEYLEDQKRHFYKQSIHIKVEALVLSSNYFKAVKVHPCAFSQKNHWPSIYNWCPNAICTLWLQHILIFHKVYWNLTRSTEISQVLLISHKILLSMTLII